MLGLAKILPNQLSVNFNELVSLLIDMSGLV